MVGLPAAPFINVLLRLLMEPKTAYRRWPGQRSRNIVLVATVDRTESHARNSLPELGHRLLSRRGSQWALFNRKGQEPDSRFAHF